MVDRKLVYSMQHTLKKEPQVVAARRGVIGDKRRHEGTRFRFGSGGGK